SDVTTPGACANSFVIVRTWTFTDLCGNASSVSQTINVNDNIAPVAPTAPADVTLSCASEVPAMISLTATDNCAGDITAEGVDTIAQGNCPNSFVITRTWTFTDACGNTTSVSQTITVEDTEAPVPPTAPADITFQCTGEVPPMISLTATDNCGEPITVEGVDTTVQGSCANSFVTTRTWTFTDACGNTSSVSQVISVNDTIAPAAPLKVPGDLTVNCGEQVPETMPLTAIDNCSGEITTVGVDTIIPGSCPNTYTVIRTWTFTDDCGNTTTVTQTINVIDNIAPVFDQTAPEDITVTCEDVPTAATLTATDNCSNATVNVTVADSVTLGACAGSYTVIRTWTATDACGNTAIQTQDITVVDQTAPVFNGTAPDDITVECDSVLPTPPTFTATDNCDNTGIAVVYAETSEPGTCPIVSVLTRTWTATDACGNVASMSQVITLQDTTGPVVNGTLEPVVNATCDAVPTVPELTFTDGCSTVGPVTFNETISDPVNGAYTILWEWEVSDSCGNASQFSQTVNVTINNSTTEIPSQICYTDTSIIDLTTLLPEGTPTGGTWVDVAGTGGLTGSNFTAIGVPLGLHVLQYQITEGSCPRNININMDVNEDCAVEPCGDIIIHNAFSPNNDGVNEHFSVENLEDFTCYPTNSVEIYNRWGVLVYDTTQYDNALNSFKGVSEGRATVNKGAELPTGTYFYILQYTTSEGTTVKKDGYLYLSR
ncbi:MAG: gliding motility-associated C-terminal domain-containing protein, partial [Flavobacterium sp.]